MRLPWRKKPKPGSWIDGAVAAMRETIITCPREGDQVPLSTWLDDETIEKVFKAGLKVYRSEAP